MATEFIAKAITPEGLVFEKLVTFLKIKTENGDVGIMARHINFISPLGAGEMLVREKDNRETTYYLEGGFLEVREDQVVILGEDILEATAAEAVKMARKAVIKKAKEHKIREEKDILVSKKRIQENLTRK